MSPLVFQGYRPMISPSGSRMRNVSSTALGHRREGSPLIDGARPWHGTAGRPHLSPSPSPWGKGRAVVISLPTGRVVPAATRTKSPKLPRPQDSSGGGARAAAAFREKRMPSLTGVFGCSPDQAKVVQNPACPFKASVPWRILIQSSGSSTLPPEPCVHRTRK